MQIVIDIPEGRFKDIQRIATVQFKSRYFSTAEQIIANGVPIPKGHGRLKDVDKIESLLDLDKADNMIAKALRNIIESVPVIIKADKTESEDK